MQPAMAGDGKGGLQGKEEEEGMEKSLQSCMPEPAVLGEVTTETATKHF